jgi:hypothetical protein
MVAVTGWADVYALVAFIALLVVARGLGPQDWKTDAVTAVCIVFWPAALTWFVWSCLRKNGR